MIVIVTNDLSPVIVGVSHLIWGHSGHKSTWKLLSFDQKVGKQTEENSVEFCSLILNPSSWYIMVLVYLAVPTAVFCSGVGERCWQAPSSTLCSQAVRWDALAQLLRSLTHTQTHTHTQLHQCEQVSVQTIVEVSECSGFVSVSVRWFGRRREKKKVLIGFTFFWLRDNAQEISSNPSGLQLGTRYTGFFFFFKCQTSSLHADNARQGTWTQHSSSLNFEVKKKTCITFSLSFLFTQKFSPWTKRQEPGTRIADAPRGER